MSEQFEFESEPTFIRGDNSTHAGNGSQSGRSGAPGKSSRLNGHAASNAIDVWTVLDLIAHRWHWLVIGAILGGAGFAMLGIYLLQPKFTATAQLIRYDTPGASEAVKGPPLTPETFSALILSPELLRAVGEKAVPPLAPDRLFKQIKVDPQPDSDVIKLHVAAGSIGEAVQLANLYAQEAVEFTTQLQARQAKEVAEAYLKKQLDEMDKDIATLQEQFRGLGVPPELTNKLGQVGGNVRALSQNLAAAPPSPLTLRLKQQLDTSIAELAQLQGKFTELHPAVQSKNAEIAILRSQYETNLVHDLQSPAGLNALTPERRALDPRYEIIGAKLNSLEYVRIEMARREREAQLFAENPPGMARVHAPATLKTTQTNHRKIKIGMVTVVGCFFGLACSLGFLVLTEAVGTRLKSVDDLKRVTRLPVLGTLTDLRKMDERARTQWAFRTWTMLQGRLSRSQNHGLVCGITSSVEGEGRSTWIKLMAEAASLSGFRVLTIATRPSQATENLTPQLTEEALDQSADMNPNENNYALTHDVLATPAAVTDQLNDPNAQPVVHIPLPGWVWNLERRKQWQNALNQWRKVDNLVIFVELPPASIPEAVLLGSNLPNLLWLAEGGTAEAAETRVQLQTLRDARCNLVGAVLNRESGKSIKQRFPRWLGCLAVFALFGASAAEAQFTNQPLATEPPPGEIDEASALQTNRSFSVVGPDQRAEWQKHLTLGPGDVITLGLYGEPLLSRTEVTIAPDGRVTYLEAQNLLATGLTVDELRAKLDEEIGKYRRAARTIITPVSYRSKRYYMLGKVVQRGAYVLDRPTTVIEALARAHGLENGMVDNNTVDLADLSRSFVMRGGQRIPLDFEKLFQGDLSQNVQIEPGDYLYFPSADVQQVYVLGEVGLPGPVVYRPDSTVLAAISARGGFNERAFKSRVLVVRGSINHPEGFAVDTMATTAGRLPDFKLEPKDIVYVSHRPFYRVEDLLDLATTAFLQSVVSAWVSTDVMEPQP